MLAGVFTVPGDGMIEFKRVAELCAEIGYEGWFVVEAEQDPKKANPLKYAKIGHEALSEALSEAGYEIEELMTAAPTFRPYEGEGGNAHAKPKASREFRAASCSGLPMTSPSSTRSSSSVALRSASNFTLARTNGGERR